MKAKIAQLILMSVAILYNGATVAASGSSTGTVLWYEGHTGVLIEQEGMSDLGACGRPDLYILDAQHSYFKEIYALILSAHIAGQPLQLTVDGCAQGISRIAHVRSAR
jgi:hypothetical protein